MDQQQAVQKIIKAVSSIESELFSGCFNESLVKSDLSDRPDKRSFYIDNFSQHISLMNQVLGLIDGNPSADELISRAKKNKGQAQKMLDYVRSY